MDSLTLDASALDGTSLQLGEEVELMGPHLTVDELAAATGVISHELLARLGARFDRNYVGEAGRPASSAP
jgi:alanine racemase